MNITTLIRFDPARDAGPTPSPCVSICRMDAASGLCEGCQRDLGEIAAWGSASEEQRRAIWTRINHRREETLS